MATTTGGWGAAVLRVGLGAVMVAHGLAKPVAYGLDGTAAFMRAGGFPGWLAYPAFGLETAGGLMLLAGVGTRWAAAALVPVMAGAAAFHAPNGFWHTAPGGGVEFPAFLAVALAALAGLGASSRPGARPHSTKGEGMQTLVTVSATATGGRDGHVRTADGKLDGRLALPPELGGDGNGLSPEHLFAAGHAACFATTLKVLAGRQGVRLGDVRVTADVGLGKEPSGAFRIASRLTVHAPDLPADRAADLLAAADEACAYSRALKGHADVTVERAG